MMLTVVPRSGACRSFVRRAPVLAPIRRGSIPRVAAKPDLPPTADVLRVRIPALQWTIENVEGKRLSIGIYTYLATTYGGKLTKEGAQEGIQLYGDKVVQDARQRPGAHPNIDLLWRVIEEGSELDLVVERQ